MGRDLSSEEAREMMGSLGNAARTTEERSASAKASYTPELREQRRKAAVAQWAEKRELMTERIREGNAERDANGNGPAGRPIPSRHSPMRRLRDALEARAGNRCEICGIDAESYYAESGRRLALHHLSYDKAIPELADVMLLCQPCHGAIHGDGRKAERTMTVANAVGKLLKALGVDLEDENFAETPRRVTAYLLEHFVTQEQFDALVEDCAAAVFPSAYDGIVVESNIRAHGVCPHHLLPVIYDISLCYIPEGGVAIGLSKLTRIAEACARLPILQEEATVLIAETLARTLRTSSVAVVVRGEHLCMQIRGIEAHGVKAGTSKMMGAFFDKPEARAEAFALIAR